MGAAQRGVKGQPPVDVIETVEAQALLETARASGSLTTEEISLALDELDLDAGQLDDFYTQLEELQIDVVGRDVEEEELPVEEEIVTANGREVSTDSLQLFLKDVGRVDLLTAAQEVELAKRIERGDHRAKQEMVEANLRLVVSLEKPVGDEEESEFGHFLFDETQPLPDEAAETALRKEALQKILGMLSYRERRVLELRYGLNGEHPRTLDEVGRTFNVTRERI